MSSPPSDPSQITSQTADPPSTFKSMLDAALIKYKNKTGEDLQAIWLASELQTCESVDSVLDLLRDQAKALDRSDDQRLMRWIDPLVHVLSTFSDALGDGVSLAFPPAKVIFTGIGVLLGAAKDARASHGAVIDLFERIEGFFKRLEVYNQISLNTKMSEVLVKIVIELLSILSIATKEVGRRRAKLFSRKLLGRTDIEDALKKLDRLIQEEFQMVTAQILKVATEVKDGVDNTNIAMQQVSNNTEEVKLNVEEVKREVEEVKWAQIEQDIQKWFSPPDPSTNYNIACEAQHEGTAAWFFQGWKFEDWMSVGSLLWINGKPGSGKSILCSAIIKRIISLRDTGQASLAYFYFDFRDKDKKQDFRNFITSLLVQLSAYSSPCCKIVSDSYSTHGKGAQQPSIGALKTCLREMLQVAAKQPLKQPTYIIVDALDECPNLSGMPTPREVALGFLKDLVGLRFRNLHICVTSRPEVDIKDFLGPLARSAVSLHEESGQMKDIFDYVRNVVYSDSMMRRWQNDQKELVIEELSKKADGMFRWVFCQLEVLRHCLPASIRQTLDHLPDSLDDTYLHVLRQIPQANHAHAHRMLQCLLVAVRPLRVEELAEVLAFEFDEAQGGIPKYRGAWQLDNQTQAVLSTCSSLVTIVDDGWDWERDSQQGRRRMVVQFSHFSVKEFLMSNRLGDFSRYHIHPLSAHTVLTQACLGVLLHLDNNGDQNSLQCLPLAKYAAEHWVEHAQFQGVASRVKNGMETLFDVENPYFSAWVVLHDIDKPKDSRQHLRNIEISAKLLVPNPLYYAVLCGFYDLVKHLAIKQPQHVNAIYGEYKFPLFAALVEDHFEIAELLLEHGANIDARETTGETMLLKVVSRPQRNLVNVVGLLLKHGADVNARDATLKSSLHLVAYRGELKVAQMLLEHKPYLNFQDCDGKTPLHILSEHGMNDEGNVLNYARLLLNHGAEVNRRDKDNQTPLFLAMMWGRFNLARILLELCADANVENNNYEIPSLLEMGASVKNKTTKTSARHVSRNQYRYSQRGAAQPLLERGVDINIQHESHITPSLLPSQLSPVQTAQAPFDQGANANVGNNGGETSSYQGSEVLDVSARPEDQPTPLHVASFYGKLDIVWLLLDHGATANSEDNFGRTPLHLAAGGTYNFERDRVRTAQLLLERGADSNALDGYHATPLHLASYYGRVAIARALLDGGADANSKDNKGRTPLHSVAEGRYLYSASDGIPVAQLLLERGADVNVADDDNRTPLHLASYHGRVEIVRALLDGDATTNLKAKQGWTPLHEMAIGGDYHSRDTLRYGVLIAQILLQRGADVSTSNDDNQTPLHLASYFGKVEVVLVLLNAGANASATNAQGQTPLHLASQCPYQGADYSQGDGVGVARLLLEHGTDVDVQDKNHATPLDLALQYGRTEIASLLLHHKDKANAKIDQHSTLHQPGSDGVQSQDENCPPTTPSLGANVSALSVN